MNNASRSTPSEISSASSPPCSWYLSRRGCMISTMLNMSYSRNRSSNQLLNYSLPTITGTEGIYRNFPATIQNSSWELALTTLNLKSVNINWTSAINLTIPQNKVTAFPEIESTTYANGDAGVSIGQPLGFIKVFHFLGVDEQTGQYLVANADGKPTSSPDYLTDRNVFVNTQPKFYGGIQNTVSYKGFQLDFLLQFVKQVGANIFLNNGLSISPGQYSAFGTTNQPAAVLPRWQNNGDVVTIQRYSTSYGNTFNSFFVGLTSDAVYRDASYLRLKNISMSWQLPELWQSKVKLKNCRVFVQAQNMLTISNYLGLDPEIQGIFSLPPLKVFTIGMQIAL